MKDTIYRNFEDSFPNIAECVIDYEFNASTMTITVTTENGESYIYSEYSNSIRRLPDDKNNMTLDQSQVEFRLRLRNLLASRCMDQKDLSKKTGISETMISRYMNGLSNPGFFVVDKIARALDCSMDDLRYR